VEILEDVVKNMPVAGILLYIWLDSSRKIDSLTKRNNELSDKIFEVLPNLTSVVNNVHDIIKASPSSLKDSVEPLFRDVKNDTTNIKEKVEDLQAKTSSIENIARDVKRIIEK